MSNSITHATPLPDSHRFPRSAHLRQFREFAAVREHGQTSQGRFLRVTVLCIPDSSDLRIGIVTSRRVGLAVERNRVRRRVREIFRMNQHTLAPGHWIVVVAKNGAAEAPFAMLREEWLRLAGRLSIVRNSA